MTHASIKNETPLLYRWDDIALDKITEMVSRKVVAGDRHTLAQVYVKQGQLVPAHAHAREQMICVLQGALRFVVGVEELTVKEGEVLRIPAGARHQAVALEDTFVLGILAKEQG
jgi:quercetin dioxygenase-like cupin family protein